MSKKGSGLKLDFEEGMMKLGVDINTDSSFVKSVSNDPHVIALQKRVTALEKQLTDMQAAMSRFLGSLNFHCFELQNKMIIKDI